MKAENAELRQSIAKLHKELEESGDGNDLQSGEVGQLKRAKRQLEAKCAEQVVRSLSASTVFMAGFYSMYSTVSTFF